MRATDGGARLAIRVETYTDTGVETKVLSPMVARLDALPRVGEIDGETLGFLEAESLFAEALVKGYRYLGGANHSPALLRKKLIASGISPALATEVVTELTHNGVLDEVESATNEAEKCLAKLWGDRRILAALRAKGYGAKALSAVAARLAEENAVLRLARLIEKRRMPLPKDEREAAKFAASLVRYGYTGGQIKAAVASLGQK